MKLPHVHIDFNPLHAQARRGESRDRAYDGSEELITERGYSPGMDKPFFYLKLGAAVDDSVLKRSAGAVFRIRSLIIRRKGHNETVREANIAQFRSENVSLRVYMRMIF